MHDYDLPADWPAMSPTERDAWFRQERARRQAQRQRTPYAARVAQARRRQSRRVEARGEVTLGDG